MLLKYYFSDAVVFTVGYFEFDNDITVTTIATNFKPL